MRKKITILKGNLITDTFNSYQKVEHLNGWAISTNYKLTEFSGVLSGDVLPEIFIHLCELLRAYTKTHILPIRVGTFSLVIPDDEKIRWALGKATDLHKIPIRYTTRAHNKIAIFWDKGRTFKAA